MGQMINVTGELIRICPAKATKIEVSKNDERSWTTRYKGMKNVVYLERLSEIVVFLIFFLNPQITFKSK